MPCFWGRLGCRASSDKELQPHRLHRDHLAFILSPFPSDQDISRYICSRPHNARNASETLAHETRCLGTGREPISLLMPLPQGPIASPPWRPPDSRKAARRHHLRLHLCVLLQQEGQLPLLRAPSCTRRTEASTRLQSRRGDAPN